MLIEGIGSSARRRPHLRFGRLRADPEAFELVQRVARRRNISITALLHPSRGRDRDASARFLAMYLVHVVLGRPQEIVGELFGRDRSTVAHACQRLEDLRDDNKMIEAEIARLQARRGSRHARRRTATPLALEYKHAA
ncbi:MAG: chromosomal replication initiator DnaA [Hyphomicrobiales bacterium]|nr:MAG: chromosomal replication initiator DnaA [Hyphomicrobiales bacterium]